MTPSRFHAPPRGTGASQIVRGGSPKVSMRLSFPSAKKPMDRPSGDQKGSDGLSVPGSAPRHGGVQGPDPERIQAGGVAGDQGEPRAVRRKGEGRAGGQSGREWRCGPGRRRFAGLSPGRRKATLAASAAAAASTQASHSRRRAPPEAPAPRPARRRSSEAVARRPPRSASAAPGPCRGMSSRRDPAPAATSSAGSRSTAAAPT